MTKEASELLQDAVFAKQRYMAGLITYEEMVAIAQKYIDHCNERAKEIAKEYGVKPRLMSVKAWLR